MSRHRRQASQVLPPEVLAGDEPSGDLKQVTAGGGVDGSSSGAAAAAGVTSSNERFRSPSSAAQQRHQDQSPASHLPLPAAKKPLPDKPSPS